jgi:hypothetical protein
VCCINIHGQHVDFAVEDPGHISHVVSEACVAAVVVSQQYSIEIDVTVAIDANRKVSKVVAMAASVWQRL